MRILHTCAGNAAAATAAAAGFFVTAAPSARAVLQTSLRAEYLQRQQAAPPKVKQDDEFPRKFAEIRRALAARLDAIVAEEEE